MQRQVKGTLPVNQRQVDATLSINHPNCLNQPSLFWFVHPITRSVGNPLLPPPIFPLIPTDSTKLTQCAT